MVFFLVFLNFLVSFLLERSFKIVLVSVVLLLGGMSMLFLFFLMILGILLIVVVIIGILEVIVLSIIILKVFVVVDDRIKIFVEV